MQRRTLIQHSLASALLLGTALAAMPAAAQGNWPTGKPITYLVPFPPGGNTDTLARVIAQPLSKALGTPVVIENKGGAGGSVGSAIAARAPADGYTILGGTISSHAINVSLYAKLDYDPVKSFTPVAMLGSGPLVLVVPASSPYKTLADVLAASKAKEGDEATRRLISHVATLLFWVLLVTCVLGVVGAPLLVWLLASGLRQSPEGYDAAVLMTRWMFPYIGFMSLVALSAGVLNTWRRFAVSAATPVLLNLAMIAAAFWGAPWLQARGIEPIYAMAGGVMLGGVLQLAVQLPALARLGLLPRIGFSPAALRQAWAEAGVRRILKLMAPALLGVGVAQVSLMINTQIASYLQPGSVTWLFYADRLMEFPTALLGVALGVVLTPQLAAAKAADDSERYSAMLDWGLRLVVLLSVPCAVGLLTFAEPLVATLFHRGALQDSDVGQIALALVGYGAGLVGLVAIKVLAPGYYASQDIRTPVKIAIVVLVITQLLNLVLVPFMAHTGLALSIGLAALVNAGWLLWGLLRRGVYRPKPGWGRLGLQVVAASSLLAVLLTWGSQHFDWIALRANGWQRVGLLAALMAASVLLYFGALWAAGLKLRALLRR